MKKIINKVLRKMIRLSGMLFLICVLTFLCSTQVYATETTDDTTTVDEIDGSGVLDSEITGKYEVETNTRGLIGSRDIINPS